MKNFIAIDFETANFQPTSICSVGMVFVENDQIINTLYSLIRPNPNYYIERFSEIHGMVYEDTQNAVTFDAFWEQTLPLIGNLALVAHNRAFDQRCLNATLEAYKLPKFKNDFFCSLIQARKKLPHLQNHKLTTVAKHCGYSLQNHHHALADAEACAVISMKLF
jgi:DNA polymerase-3 subunit epsilon